MRHSRRTLFLAPLAIALAACNGDAASSTSPQVTLGNPSIAIGVPTAISIRPRNSTIVPVTIIRTDYAGPVFVVFSGLPKGVSGPSVSSTSTNKLDITLNADSTAVPGVTPVTVNMTGNDVTSVSATFQLTVQSP